MSLCRLTDTVRAKINTPSNQTANKNVSKCPSIGRFFENNIFIASCFRLNVNSLTIKFADFRCLYGHGWIVVFLDMQIIKNNKNLSLRAL